MGGEEDDLENYVCFTAEIDPKAKDAAKYRELALAKAFVSLKTGMASSLVQTQYPYLYDAGDTKWGGSTIMPGGIIIGFSGVQAVFDEMIAEWMASAIRAIYRDIMTCKGGMMDQPSGFIVG
ncbi:hypothetical protein FWF48_01380 [Candidatus Saccharibacteria bacterium]|nr:hypothetical protein [Candidatus Saccharibacteria bacterium]